MSTEFIEVNFKDMEAAYNEVQLGAEHPFAIVMSLGCVRGGAYGEDLEKYVKEHFQQYEDNAILYMTLTGMYVRANDET